MRFQGSLKAAPLAFTAAALVLVTAACLPALGQTESVLYSFQDGPDGAQPLSGLVAGPAGNLFGTTVYGGNGFGTVYEMMPPAVSGRAWTETVLYAFQGGTDGAYPYAPLAIGSDGALYGTTTEGGVNCSACGTVFKLARPGKRGGGWTESVLYSFSGPDGASPYAGLVFDDAGNLLGTTITGGVNDEGTVFELIAPDSDSKDRSWREKVLYSFTGGADGGLPISDIAVSENVRLYGTTILGGNLGAGTVFELAHAPGGSWSETAIYSFTGGSDGAEPYVGVVFDGNGDLDGAALFGGNTNCVEGCGTIFQLTPPAHRGGSWSENTLYQFTGGNDGAQPITTPILDARGKLFGAASVGGNASAACAPDCGSVYVLTPPRRNASTWTETTLYDFQGGTDGYFPQGNLLLGKHGELYGTTQTGGASVSAGTVFQIIP